MQDAATIAVTGAPSPQASAGRERWRVIVRTAFPFVVVGAIWEAVARYGIFPHQLFPTLEDVARSFVELTIAGITMPSTRSSGCSPASGWRRSSASPSAC